MKKWLIKRLQWMVARRELEQLYRYRVACELVRQWNAGLQESASTAEWIQQVGEGERGFDIERLREQLRGASDDLPF